MLKRSHRTDAAVQSHEGLVAGQLFFLCSISACGLFWNRFVLFGILGRWLHFATRHNESGEQRQYLPLL